MTDSLRALEGTQVGRHRLDRLLRQGGMGGVFFGEHVHTGARVAIKVQHASAVGHPELAARFDREAQMMGRLSGCPGVVTVHDVGSLPDGRRYLVMDFVRGMDLGDVLVEIAAADERMDLDRACSIMAEVASALSATHARAVVHRDLKPANIMLESTRGGERVLLLDFGVSADLGERGQAQALTAAGEVIGTPQYMAPEQAVGVTSAPAVDIYAMGAILHQLLTGLAPPETGWQGERVPVASVRKTPARLVRILESMLQLDASRRIGSAREVELELQSILGELRRPAVAVHERFVQLDAVAGVMTVDSGARGHAQAQPGGHRRWAWKMGAAVLALATTLTALWWWWAGPTADPKSPAEPAVAVAVAQPDPTRAAGPAPDSPSQPQPDPPPTTGSGPEAVADDPSSSGPAAPPTPTDLPPTKPAPAPDPDPDPDPAPAPAPAPDRCALARKAAQAAHGQGRWSAVLQQSKRRACWNGPAAGTRQAMRVKAYLELKQYPACIREGEGAGAGSPKVAKMVAFCKRKAPL